jgi:hypothetical protein
MGDRNSPIDRLRRWGTPYLDIHNQPCGFAGDFKMGQV